MKTKMNINQIARISFASLAVFFISAVSPILANNENNTAYLNSEYRVAAERLVALNMTIEESLKFTAPAVDEDVEAYEIQAASERLENLNLTVEETIRYQASNVNEEAETYEVAVAKERLENLNLAVEQSIRFIAPAGKADMEFVSVR